MDLKFVQHAKHKEKSQMNDKKTFHVPFKYLDIPSWALITIENEIRRKILRIIVTETELKRDAGTHL